MEKLLRLVKERKITMFLCWVVLVVLLYAFFAKVIFITEVTALQILFVVGVSIIVYLSIVITLEYLSSKKKLLWVNSIYDQFVHMQIFLDNNNVILEVLEGECEKVEQLAAVRSFQTERISNKNDLVKILVK